MSLTENNSLIFLNIILDILHFLIEFHKFHLTIKKSSSQSCECYSKIWRNLNQISKTINAVQRVQGRNSLS